MKNLIIVTMSSMLILFTSCQKEQEALFESISPRAFEFTQTQFGGCFPIDIPLDREGNLKISTGVQFGRLSMGSKDPRVNLAQYTYVEVIYSGDIITSHGDEYFINSNSYRLFIDPYDFDREIELFTIEDIRCGQNPRFIVYEIHGYF